jgi:hypothetical protein
LGQSKILIQAHIFAQNFVHLASKLIQHVIAIGSIKNLDTGSFFAQNFDAKFEGNP